MQELRKIVAEKGAHSLVFMDESGFEHQAYRPYAYAPRGQKIHGNRSGKRHPRTNLMLGYQAGKLLAPMLFDCSATTALVNHWFQYFLLKELRPNSTIILDNARFHNKKDLEEIVQKEGHQILFLPPYSPDFNPIEKTFANIKKYRQSQPPNTTMDEIIKSYGSYLD